MIAPSAITNLTVVSVARTQLGLRWSATGDDNNSGMAVSYDLRHFKRTITVYNWDSATVVAGLPVPGMPGEFDSMTVNSLLEDSTYYFGIKVSDEAGNESPLSNVVMAVCFNDFAVTFADTVLERIIRFYVGKPTGDILRSDLTSFEALNVENQHLHDLSGIEHLINLRSVRLWNNQVTDLSPLAGLSKLRVLKAGYNGLADISALAPLTLLDTLHLNANCISDLTALSGMTCLDELVLTSNLIWDTGPLTGKTTIRTLALDGNQIVFTNPLYNLTELEKLRLSGNLIEDLLPLAANPGLNAGDSLWLDNNPLTASSTDSLLTALRSRGVTIIE